MRCEAATPPPWVHRFDPGVGQGVSQPDYEGSDKFILERGANGLNEDVDFAAEARTDLPDALAALEVAWAEIERLHAELDTEVAVRQGMARERDRACMLSSEQCTTIGELRADLASTKAAHAEAERLLGVERDRLARMSRPLTEDRARGLWRDAVEAWDVSKQSIDEMAIDLLLRISRGDYGPASAPAHSTEPGERCAPCTAVLGSASPCAISHDFGPAAYGDRKSLETALHDPDTAEGAAALLDIMGPDSDGPSTGVRGGEDSAPDDYMEQGPDPLERCEIHIAELMSRVDALEARGCPVVESGRLERAEVGLELVTDRVGALEAAANGCPDACGAAKEAHCWNASLWAEPVKLPGALVTFIYGTRPCVGYIDSIDTDTPLCANVTAMRVEAGRWKREGNPSLDAMSCRVPLADLTVLMPPPVQAEEVTKASAPVKVAGPWRVQGHQFMRFDMSKENDPLAIVDLAGGMAWDGSMRLGSYYGTIDEQKAACDAALTAAGWTLQPQPEGGQS